MGVWPSLATMSEDDRLPLGIIQSSKVGIEFAVQADGIFFTTARACHLAHGKILLTDRSYW